MNGWLHSYPLFFFLPFYCFGLLIGGQYPKVNILFLLSCFLCLIISFCMRSRYILAISFIFLGAFWQSQFFHPPAIIKFNNQTVVLKGRLVNFTSRNRIILDDISLFVNKQKEKVEGKVLLKVFQPDINLQLGHIIKVKGKLKLIITPANPGAYNFAKEWQRKGIWMRMNASGVQIIGYKKPWFILYFLENIRKNIRKFLFQHLTQPIKGIYRALLLGEKENISPDVRDIFALTGTSHLLAISGLHLGMVMGLFYALFWYLFSRSERLLLKFQVRKISVFLALIPSLFYASLAHFSPATLRSFLMLLLFWWLYFSRRLKNKWLFLTSAAWIMLIFDPTFIYSVSFQLSFAALAFIFYFTPKMLKFYRCFTYQSVNFKERIKRYFLLCFCASLSAWIGTMPLVMHYFGNVALCAPFLNILAIPWMGFCVLPTGLLSLFCLPFSETMAVLFLKVGSVALSCLISFLEKFTSIPGTSFWYLLPNWFEVIVFYLCIVSIFQPRFFVLTALSFLIVEFAFYLSVKPKGFEVSFFGVGEGTSIFLHFPNNKTMLIGGGGSRSTYDPGRFVVARALWAKRIYTLDYLVLPTPHYRYLKGLKFLARHFHPKILWTNGVRSNDKDYLELVEICKKKGISIIFPKTQEINGVNVKILYPKENKYLSLKDSLFMQFQYNKFRFLFPFYLKKEVLRQYASKTDILLAPNFGAKEANFAYFIKITSPQYVVFSRSPSKAVLENYLKVGSHILITSKHGTINFLCNGEELKIRIYNN